MMRAMALYVMLIVVGALVCVIGNETLVMLCIVGVLALIVGMFAVAPPVRPPRRRDCYRKNDMDWPAEDVLEGEWTLLTDAGPGLYLAAPEEGGAL